MAHALLRIKVSGAVDGDAEMSDALRDGPSPDPTHALCRIDASCM